MEHTTRSEGDSNRRPAELSVVRAAKEAMFAESLPAWAMRMMPGVEYDGKAEDGSGYVDVSRTHQYTSQHIYQDIC